MFVDQAIIIVTSGKGGDGHVSFARYKYIPKGGPSGGDGGAGGSVYLDATPGVDTLLDLAGRHHWVADNGENGGIKQCTGANAEDLHIRVPPGTLVYNNETGELLADLDKEISFLVAKGGKGGYGNDHFKHANNQAPREFTPGEEGATLSLRLELKLIADIGLLGKPNAGKSTLLSVISRARPKIANYPFTTLEPNLGIADLSGERRMVIADIPGLIEGAHLGQGLGTQFLRHVERTRLLVHLLEIEPADGSDPIENYRVICAELASYSQTLGEKPQIIALTKMDLLATDADRKAAKKLIEKELGLPVIPISSATGSGIEALLEHCWKQLAIEKLKPAPPVSLPTHGVKKAKPKAAEGEEPGDIDDNVEYVHDLDDEFDEDQESDE